MTAHQVPPFTLEEIQRQAQELKPRVMMALYHDRDVVWSKFGVDILGIYLRIYRPSASYMYWSTFAGVRALNSPLRDPMHPMRVCGFDILESPPANSRIGQNMLAHRDDLFFVSNRVIDDIADTIRREAHNTKT